MLCVIFRPVDMSNALCRSEIKNNYQFRHFNLRPLTFCQNIHTTCPAIYYELLRGLYGMEAKTFHSRLFKRKINPDNPDYWTFLYADLLFRIRELDDRNCFCHYCNADKAKFNSIIADMVNDKLIE